MERKTAKENIQVLPEYCFSVNLVTNELCRILCGERGYYPLHKHHAAKLAGQKVMNADAFADKLNASIGVTKGQREAMEIGSMFGYDVPGANPDNYNSDGSLKKN